MFLYTSNERESSQKKRNRKNRTCGNPKNKLKKTGSLTEKNNAWYTAILSRLKYKCQTKKFLEK